MSSSPEDEFDSFYAARAEGLVRSIYARTGDLDRAHDSVQEAFARAWANWTKLDDQDPTAWVRKVAWRLAVSDWRSRMREGVRLRRVAGAEREPPEVLLDELVSVRNALASLSRDQQTVIVLHYFEDLRVEDVALMTGMPASTVKSHLRRGRLALQEKLETRDADESVKEEAQ